VVSETPVGKLESIRQVLDVDQKARTQARAKVAAMFAKDRKSSAVVGREKTKHYL
jgi:hypothetical protein